MLNIPTWPPSEYFRPTTRMRIASPSIGAVVGMANSLRISPIYILAVDRASCVRSAIEYRAQIHQCNTNLIKSAQSKTPVLIIPAPHIFRSNVSYLYAHCSQAPCFRRIATLEFPNGKARVVPEYRHSVDYALP